MNKDIFRQSCLLQLRTSIWTGSKSLDPAALQQLGNSEWLRGKKNLVDPYYLGPIKTTVMKARKYLSKMALPFPLNSLTLIPKNSIPKVEEGLKEFETEFWSHTESFLDHYELAREEAKNVLGDLFQETDYSMNLRGKFAFNWQFILLDVPKKSSILPPDIYIQEKQKFQLLMEEAQETAMIALRMELTGLLSHMTERLSDSTDGKPKIIRNTTAKNLNEFFESFQDRNLFNDDQLQALIEQAKEVVNSIPSPFAIEK